MNNMVACLDRKILLYVNLPHGASYQILSIFLVLVNKVFLNSFPFFDFTGTMLFSLLFTCYIYNMSTGYSIPFKVFYKVIFSVAGGQNSFYIRFHKHGIPKAQGQQLGDQIVFKATNKHTQLSNSVGAKILRATIQLELNIYGL